MRFHAERIQSVGAGLLSESNHGLKNSIKETNAILEGIAAGLYEKADVQDPLAFIEDNLLPQVAQFMVVKIKKQFPNLNDNQIADFIVNGLRQSGKVMGLIKSTSRLAAKKDAGAMGRQIKRGM